MSENKNTSLKTLVNTLMTEMEKCDPQMKKHATNVANRCVMFSRELGRPAKEINQIYLASLLHDIGMIYIPPQIACKKCGLNESEMAYIKKHTLLSEKILSKYGALSEVLPIIRYHHEAVDGSGYPEGLKGSEIPVSAKILSIINRYESLITDGLEGRQLSNSEALEEIKRLAGIQFDEKLVESFIKYIRSEEDEDDQEYIEKETVTIPSDPEPEMVLKGEVRTMVSDIIAKFKKNDADLPVLPAVVKDIQEVLNSPSSGVDQLAAVIEKDAVISVRLISIANSALYRGADKIVTVKQAIPRIGAKETQSTVATIANKGLYEVKDRKFSKLMEKLWNHSLASAFAAKNLAEILEVNDTEKYYFMGLTHDIGKVLILKGLGDILVENHTYNIDDILTVAKESHTSFGSSMLRKWGFTDEYSRICLLHASSNFKSTTDADILAINLAGNIAKKAGFSITTDPDQLEIATLSSRILLGIEPPDIDHIIENVKNQMNSVSEIFN